MLFAIQTQAQTYTKYDSVLKSNDAKLYEKIFYMVRRDTSKMDSLSKLIKHSKMIYSRRKVEQMLNKAK